MASTTDELNERFASVLKDVENFYVDTKNNDESHKIRALQFFSKMEIDQYCEMTVSLASYTNFKTIYQNKVLAAQQSIAGLQKKSEKLRENIAKNTPGKDLDKSADKKLNLETSQAKIISAEDGIKLNDRRVGYCLDDIKELQAKIDEGEQLIQARDKLIQAMRSKFS